MFKYVKFYAPLSFLLFLVGCTNVVDSLDNALQNQSLNFLQSHGFAAPASQTIASQFSDQSEQWKIITHSFSPQGFFVQYVPQAEDSSNWTQSMAMVITSYQQIPDATAEKFVQKEVAVAKQSCATIDYRILNKQAESITYVLNVSHCSRTGNIGQDENEDQIGKVFNGRDAVYAIRYAAVKGSVSPQEFRKHANAIKTSHLIDNPLK